MADEGADMSATGERDALISELRAHNDTLREQLEAERQGHAEARRLLAAALERIPPQLEAPKEASEALETVEEAPEDRAEPHPEAGEAREELVAERALREMAEATLHEGMAEERRRREEAERERDDLRRVLYARSREPRESPETVEEERGGVVEPTSYAVEVHGSSREATEAHEAAEEQQQGRGQPPSDAPGAQEGAQRRPWWRRLFRG